jgi:hypothetical protein
MAAASKATAAQALEASTALADIAAGKKELAQLLERQRVATRQLEEQARARTKPVGQIRKRDRSESMSN